ncbi:MAG: serine/threonine protein kinase [Candidatus Bathyarchaeota archaeon B26-1]|nr:MAG: serine/threonine protein kinase [Candidatus Bathyarchaeota archaeon B26-1]
MDSSSPSRIVRLESLRNEPYCRVVCYPNYSPDELERRLREMARLGVEALEFSGSSFILNVPVLGKGCVGVVVAAYTEAGKAALKIRRTDANRESMKREAEMLRLANSVEVGPRLIAESENILMMEFIEGTLLPEWIKTLNGEEREVKERVRRVLREVLEQSRRLDKIGLDHGELSRASRHIIIGPDESVHILDFETASVKRRVSNVTSVSQFLFVGGGVAEAVAEKLGEVRREEVIQALRAYKTERSDEAFHELLKACRLI